MKRILSTFFIFLCSSLIANAVDFDASIDSEIRQEHNVAPSTLPELPSSVPTYNPVLSEMLEEPSHNPTGKIYTLRSGTKINLYSKSTISDWMKEGNRVSFSAKEGIITKEGDIIPAGTVFKGIITDAHRPQITGNGGLIELKIDEIYYNGVMSKIETKVSLANSKRIFLSNIKGQRSYWKNFAKAMTPGTKVFKATQTCASAMAPIPVVNVLSVVPLAGGAIVYTANLVVAPVISIFQKGGSISLPQGTEFQIKLTENSQIRG